jgi:putative FmdB family regulatory protein
MPLYEYLCQDCGEITEFLVTGTDDKPCCQACGRSRLKKLLSAPSSLSGKSSSRLPGPGDTPCCGTTPAQAGCAGPGSCCGKSFSDDD